MKKSSLKTSTKFDPPNTGTANNRLSKGSPAEGGKPYADEFQLKGESKQPEGTANNRYGRSKPGGPQPTGNAQPLRTNSPMRDDVSSIGSGVLTKSTPVRKRA